MLRLAVPLVALVIALAGASEASASACVSAADGPWASAATWTDCGGGHPAAGDSATIGAHDVGIESTFYEAELAPDSLSLTDAAGGIVFTGTYSRLDTGSMTASAGTITGRGEVQVAGAFTKSTAGQLVVQNGGALDLTGTSTVAAGSICLRADEGAQSVFLSVSVRGPMTIAPSVTSPFPCTENVGFGGLRIEAGGSLTPGADQTTINTPTMVFDSTSGFATPDGLVTVPAQKRLSFATPIDVMYGDMTVAEGGRLHVETSLLVRHTGHLRVDGTMEDIVFVSDGATVSGTGTIDASLQNDDGTIRPGNDGPGTLTLTGLYSQGEEGTLHIDVDGPAPGTQHDVLAVAGRAGLGIGTLGGTLAVDRAPAYDPANGATFAFLASDNMPSPYNDGEPPTRFATVTGGDLPGGRSLVAEYPDPAPPAARLKVQVPVAPRAGTPAVSGGREVGQQLTCDPGTWSQPSTLTYAWLRDGAAISGATAAAYNTTEADREKELACRVTGTNAGGSATATSGGVLIGLRAPLFFGPPSISGTPAPGNTLTCTPGSWSGRPTFEIRWKVSGVQIGSGPQYAVTEADRGRFLVCEVTASNEKGSASNSIGIGVAPAQQQFFQQPTYFPPPLQQRPPTYVAPLPTTSTTRTTRATPRLVLPSSRRCANKRRFVVRLAAPRGVRLRSAVVRYGSRRIKVKRSGSALVASAKPPKGRFRLSVVATTSGGTLRAAQAYRTCR